MLGQVSAAVEAKVTLMVSSGHPGRVRCRRPLCRERTVAFVLLGSSQPVFTGAGLVEPLEALRMLETSQVWQGDVLLNAKTCTEYPMAAMAGCSGYGGCVHPGAAMLWVGSTGGRGFTQH